MIKIKRPPTEREENAVTDIRRVREQLSAECGNDVFHLGRHVSAIAAVHRAKLGLKSVPVPEDEAKADNSDRASSRRS